MKDIFLSWQKICKQQFHLENVEKELYRRPIWYNSQIKVNRKSLFIEKWYKKVAIHNLVVARNTPFEDVTCKENGYFCVGDTLYRCVDGFNKDRTYFFFWQQTRSVDGFNKDRTYFFWQQTRRETIFCCYKTRATPTLQYTPDGWMKEGNNIIIGNIKGFTLFTRLNNNV